MATLSPTSPVSPLGPKEEGIIGQYFLFISQFAHDKAKELVEKERDAHKAAFGSSWALMVHSLIQFASAEKMYMSLAFLEQKWFARSKDSLRNSYHLLMQELRKVEDGVRQQELSGFGFPGPTVEFEQLIAHLCGQLCHFVTARQKTMDFYEQLSIMGTNKNMNYEDLVTIITEIIQSHSKCFHHPLLSHLKSGFSAECDVISHLLNAHLLMSQYQFLPSLLQLHQAHSKLTDWGAQAHLKEEPDACEKHVATKKSFGGSTKQLMWPSLYQWLLKYKCLLVAKFSLYFYDILSKQTTTQEMKALTAKTAEDYVAKIIAFHKKSDANNISLVLDTNGIEVPYKGPGYHHPKREVETAKGLDSYPAVFSYPSEHPPSQHWPNVVMMITDRNTVEHLHDKVHCVYDKGVQSTYFITKVDARLTLVVIYESKKSEKDSYVNNFLMDLSVQLRCVKLFSALKPGSRVTVSRR